MPPAPSSAQQEELKTLRLFRATLESVSQLLSALEEDLETTAGNVDVIGQTSGRLKAVVQSVESGVKKGKAKDVKPEELDVEMQETQ